MAENRTASHLCRTALMLFQEAMERADKYPDFPERSERVTVPVAGLHGVLAWVGDDELSDPLSVFREQRLRTLMNAWAWYLQGTELGSKFLMLPMGFMSAANERLDGLSMRCIIQESKPVEGRDMAARMSKYYDIASDEFKEAPCSMAVSFWVHSKDNEVRMWAPKSEQ